MDRLMDLGQGSIYRQIYCTVYGQGYIYQLIDK